MKWITHPVLVALGIATLCTMSLPGPFISFPHEAVYHLAGSGPALFVPVELNICAVWGLLTVILWLAGRFRRLRAAVWCFLLATLPWILLKNVVSMFDLRLTERMAATAFIFPLAAMLGAAVLWWPERAAIFERVQGFASTLFGFSSLAGMVVLVQLFWFGWEARNLNRVRRLHQPSSVSRLHPHSRVIWIILDELSFQQVYEQRFPGLRLPAFDDLATTATVFTDVKPAGGLTANVVPSLITGYGVDRLDVTGGGQLRALHDPVSGVWRPFDPRQTVFQDALDAGYSTAIAGWHIPYCRILPEVLDHCFWIVRSSYHGHMASDRGLAANLAGPYRGFGSATYRYLFMRGTTSSVDIDPSLLHIADFTDLMSASDALLSDSSSDFILLHLPIPHPGGIFDRRRGTLTTRSSSYVDNLALADQSLAHIRQLLERKSEWESSAILVMGDHSWRTWMWAPTVAWTAEDQAASHGGQFDDRPAYIVKLPGQRDAARIDDPFAATRTRALLDAILAGRLRTSDDLRTWVEQGQR